MIPIHTETPLTEPDNTDYHISAVTARKIKSVVGALGIDTDFVYSLMCKRYKIQDGYELTEAQAESFLEHLKGYAGD